MLLGAIGVGSSLALPDANPGPNLFGRPYGPLSNVNWPLQIPLGYLAIALAAIGGILGILLITRVGGRTFGTVGTLVWVGLSGAILWWWYTVTRGELTEGPGAILVAVACLIGVVGAVMFTVGSSGNSPRG
jgi:hypothetical protein